MSRRRFNRPPPPAAEYVVGEMYEFKPEDDKVRNLPAPLVELTPVGQFTSVLELTDHNIEESLLRTFCADPRHKSVFDDFAAKYQPRIKQVLLRRGLQDADADDLTANILLHFFEHEVFNGFVFQNKPNFLKWLHTVVNDKVLSFLRTRRNSLYAWSVGNAEAQKSLEGVTRDVVGDLESEYAEVLDRVEAARCRVRDRVDLQSWNAFRMVVDEQISASQVETILHMNKNAVYQSVSRIRRLLREELADLHSSQTDENRSTSPSS